MVEIREVKKGAYYAYIKFPNILYQNQLTEIRDEKILIQIDTDQSLKEYILEQSKAVNFKLLGLEQL